MSTVLVVDDAQTWQDKSVICRRARHHRLALVHKRRRARSCRGRQNLPQLLARSRTRRPMAMEAQTTRSRASGTHPQTVGRLIGPRLTTLHRH